MKLEASAAVLTIVVGCVGNNGIVLVAEEVELVTLVAITIKLTTLPALTDRLANVAVELATDCVVGLVNVPLIVNVYDVAYNPPDQLILNPNVVNAEVTMFVGCVGAGGVGKDTLMAVEDVAPLEFVANTITLYVIGPYKFVNVAV